MLIFSLFSCDRFHENNYDFPKHITFPAEGGTQHHYGGVGCPDCTDFFIFENDEHDENKRVFPQGIGDTVVACYDWLTVQGEKFKDGLTITAAPNTTKSPRFVTIKIYTSALEYGYIKVRQNGKTE